MEKTTKKPTVKKFQHATPKELKLAEIITIRKEVLLSAAVADILNVMAFKHRLNLKNYMEKVLIKVAKTKNFEIW